MFFKMRQVYKFTSKMLFNIIHQTTYGRCLGHTCSVHSHLPVLFCMTAYALHTFSKPCLITLATDRQNTTGRNTCVLGSWNLHC